MARPNPIRLIMEAELPSLTYQRRKLYRPTEFDVNTTYRQINRYIFDNQLTRPEIIVKSNVYKVWGCCTWLDTQQHTGSWCRITLGDKWFCPQWFLNTLAHEMVHQWQWDIHRAELDAEGKKIPIGSGAHGPSFFRWREQFAEYGLDLKTAHGQRRWFKHQDFSKC